MLLLYQIQTVISSPLISLRQALFVLPYAFIMGESTFYIQAKQPRFRLGWADITFLWYVALLNIL